MDASEAGSQAAPANSFSITKELALSSDISIACWCPTMDLCAVVSADGQLHLHRMDWQLLWAVAPEALVTAVCWRPDGKQLALGHANGAISILDVETGDITAEHKVHYAAINSITWSDQHTSSTSSTDTARSFSPQHSVLPHQRYKRLFVPPIMEPHPPGSTDPLPDPYDMCMEAVGSAEWPVERPGLSLLIAADVRGLISLWLQGQVQIAEVTATVAVPDQNSEDDESAEREKYKLLHVVPDSDLDQILTVNRSPSGSVVLAAHSLLLLQHHQQPLQQCTALFAQLQSFLKAAVKCVEVACSDWCSAMGEFKKRFDTQLKQELADHGSSITVPQQELLLLLATSSCTPPLQSFLANTLGEAGLRRLARSIDGVCSGLHTALLERVMALGELVLFLLGELRGCVACGAAAGCWLGLQVQQVQQLELHAAALLLRTEQLRRTTTTIACQYRAFFSWLLKTIQQMEGSAHDLNALDGSSSSSDAGIGLPVCNDVLAFLKSQFSYDVIGPELSGSSLSSEAQLRAEAFFYQGISPSETHRLLALLTPSHPNALNRISSLVKSNTQNNITMTSPTRLSAAGCSSTPQQQQQQLVDTAAEACSRSLAQQLQHLSSLCDELFEQPLMVISPSIAAVTAQLQLLPASAAAAAAARVSGSEFVAVGPPLLQPKQCVDLHIYCCCLVPPEFAAAAAAAAAAARNDTSDEQQQQQQQSLLVTKLPSQGLVQQQQQVEAVVLLLQAGQAAVAWQFYKEQQLAVIMQSTAAAAAAGDLSGPDLRHSSTDHITSSSSSSLYLLDLSGAPWAAVQSAVQLPPLSSRTGTVFEQCVEQDAIAAIADLPHRSRQLHHRSCAGQLAVSRSRGLASLVSDMQHLILLDLEDDEEGEEEGAEDDSGDSSGAVDDDSTMQE